MNPERRPAGKVEYIARLVPKGLETGLRNYWYPVMRSGDLPAGKPVGFKLLDEPLVAWRGRDGKPRVARDRCPHRGAKLSPGRVLDGDLQCSWHGLRFGADGRCTLIPWEEPGNRYLDRVKIPAYPAEELVGWVWAYLGETERFPAPPLADCAPEEFLKQDEFITFSHPVILSPHNWLQAIDGNDAFHAVMLHSDSQASAREGWSGEGRPPPAPLPIEDRRMKIVETPQGLRGIVADMDGNQIHHGHFMEGWKGERWTLPGLYSIPIKPATNVQPYVARVYQFAVDATHTQSSRFASMRARTPEERERCTRLWNEVVGPRQRQVLQEDLDILDTIGDIAESRASEFLFPADRDVIATRRFFCDAFLAQLEGERPLPTREALVFPF